MKTCQLSLITVSAFLAALIALAANTPVLAQSPALDPPTASSEAVPVQDVAPRDKKALISAEAKAAGQVRGDGPATCSGDATQLLFPLDGSYAPVNFCAPPLTPGFDQAQCTGDPPDQHNDDDSSQIPLNFTFSLFADTYTTVWANNNGILSFGSFFEEFSPLAFPDPGLPPLVSPFWADVDTGLASTVQHGDVWFKQFDSDGSGSDDTLVVTWENVGYFDDHGDLLNTFQVIISDGTNPVMGLGTDLCFSYDNMCWTGGDAAGGVGGLGGTPATVGVNRGNGVDFFQAGRFDHAGVDFDGPFGAADGVSYLDGRVICFAPCDVAGDCDDSNACTDDACTNGVCEHTPVAGPIACGDPSDTECDNPDTCDAGQCQANNEPGGVACGDPGDTDCDNPDTCDGAGACVGNLEPPGTACGDPSDTDCDNPDTCDGGGGCDSNNESPGTSCPDDGEECTDDVCDAGATCTHPAVLDGTVCTDDGNDCTSDNCLAGTCEHPFEPVDTPCGDPADTDCTDPDTCDGSGVCLDKNEPDAVSCADDGSPGTEDVCEGGVCVHNEIPGACCVGATGLCADPVFLAACQGPLDSWTANATCAEVSCPRNVPAGEDCYRMECGLQEYSFSDNPIPADFFCPLPGPSCTSDPFDGAISLSGAGKLPPNYDVTLARLGDMDFGDVFPSERTVDVELVALNLVNCDPIEVVINGDPVLWNVVIGMSSTAPPPGTLTATKENEDGGFFTLSYFVNPVFTFSRVDDPSAIRTFDSGDTPVVFETLGSELWEHDPDIEGTPCGVAFFPGTDVQGLGRAAAQCCKDVAGGSVPGCKKCTKGACALDCGTAAVSCTDVKQTNVKKSAEKECENLPGSGLGGEYLGNSTNCSDFDCDGIANSLENNRPPCGTKTKGKKFDSDGDGIGDGAEVLAGTDPNDPCDPPSGTCTLTTPAPCSKTLPDCECTDFVSGAQVRIACALKDPDNDCGAPSVTDIPNTTPNGIPDSCEDDGTNFWGACCAGPPQRNACFNATTNQCAAFPGGIFQGYCTRCPTNLRTANHGGVSVGHFTTRPPVCENVTRAAGPEDCSLRTKYYDTWQTDLSGGDQMCHEFGLPGGTPVIPADFFRTGSLAFGGSICLEGEPLGFVSIDVPGGPLIEGEFGDADTMVLRSDDPIERCASTSPIGETVDVQVIALNLVSIGSFTVEFDVGPSEEWIAEVSVSDTAMANLPLGSLTAVKTHCNGGTYNSVLNVLPKFTFIKVDDPNVTRVLDFGDPSPAGFDPVQLTQNNNPPWVHEHFGDVDLASDPCTEFNPGIEAQNVQTVCDCNTNGQRDLCDIETGIRSDCNRNGTPDDCDVDPTDPDGNGLVSVDCNGNGIPDECEDDCNANGIADACDITAGAPDVNLNGTPDGCEPDCNGNGVPDGHDLATGTSSDCNGNGVADECELASGVGEDCNENATPDSCDIAGGTSQDCNGDGVPDECEVETPTLAASPHNIRKNRYISIIPENFGACDVDIRVTLTNTLVAAVDVGQIGSQWWANAPDANCISILGPTRPLTLPSWDACPTLHLTGCPLIPTATYDIVAMVRSTVSDPTLVAETQLLPADNKWWGDAVGFFTGSEWTGPQGVTNFDDVNACLRTFINPAGSNATHTSVTDVHPNRPDLGGNNVHPNRLVNIDDVFQFIKAFQGFEYPGFDLAGCTDP